MKAKDIEQGGRYLAKVSGNIVTVHVNKIGERWDSFRDHSVTRYEVTNLTTGRRTTFKTAARFRSPVKSNKEN